MRSVGWKPEKNEWIKSKRGFSFEEVEKAIAEGGLLAVMKNKNYPDQIVLVVEFNSYILAVPTLVKKDTFFFMTAFPSRALLKKYGNQK